MDCLMDHIVLNVEDEEAMVSFYSEVVGFGVERLEEYRNHQVPFPSVRLNADTIIDLFPKRLWQGQGAIGDGAGHLNHFCISLEQQSWDDLVERLMAHGVAIEDGPVPRWGAHGSGTSIYFRDPEGNMIEARYYEGHDTSKKCLLGT